MAEYMEGFTKKNVEKLKIYEGVTRREEIERAMLPEKNYEIPQEDQSAYSI